MQDSSLAIRPILSNLGNRYLPLNMPSLLILIRHGPFGLPASGISGLIPLVRCGFGAGLVLESVSSPAKRGQDKYLMEIPP